MPVRDSLWRWDPNVPSGDGNLPLDPRFEVPGYSVSQVMLPAVNSMDPNFEAFRDHTFRYEYETVATREDTGEVLCGVKWEIRWRATRRGAVILVEADSPRKRTDVFEVFDRLVHAVHIEER